MQQFTTQKVAQDYQNLAHPNPEVREQANIDLLQFKSSTQAWLISKELLNFQQDQSLQFLGAQVLYLKIRNDYAFLQEQEIEQIKQFVFENINEGVSKFSPQTFKQLCASAAVIGLKMIQNHWKNFITDMLTLAGTSNQNLYAVLEILSTLCTELLGYDVQTDLVNQIRTTLSETKEYVAKFLKDVIVDRSREADIINKALECVSSWAQLRAFEILEYPGLVESLLTKLDSEQTMAWAVESLCEGIKHSVHADILSTTRIEYSFDVLPPRVKDSVKIIIKSLYEIQNLQKDLNSSPFCAYLSELASHVGRYFSVIILENTEHSKALLQFLLLCTAHENKKTSVSTFDFWSTFALDATKSNVLPYTKNTSFDFIPEAYIELFKILVDKCKLKSTKILSAEEASKAKIHNVEANVEEDFDEDDLNIDFTKQDLSVREYRTLVKDAFEGCYIVLSYLKEEDGINTLFSLIIPPLTKQFAIQNNVDVNDPDYILNCESLIFGTRCFLDLIEPTQANPYVLEMIKTVLTLPMEEILTRGVFRFLVDAAQQLKYLPEFADQLFEYCLRDIANPNLRPAIDCFQCLTELLGDQIGIQTFERIATLMDQTVYKINDPKRSSQCITSVIYVSRHLQSFEIKVKFLQRACKSIQEKFKIFTQNLDKAEGKNLNDVNVRQDALKLFTILANILHGFELECQEESTRSAKLMEETVLPFILESLEYICIFLELFHSHQEFVQTFSSVIRIAIKLCETKIENFYEKILFTILKVFEADPFRNMSLLDTMNTLILLFQDSPKQKEWIFANFSKFNAFISTSLLKTYEQNSELLLKWMDILIKVLDMYRDFFLSLKELEQLIDFVMRAFYEFNDYKLQRKTINFLVTLIGNKTTVHSPTLASFLPKILAFALVKLPDLDVPRIKHVSRVVSAMVCALENEEAYIIDLFFAILKMDAYKEIIERTPKELFLKGVFLYRNDDKMIFNILQNFGKYALNPVAYGGSIMYIQIKIMEKQQEMVGNNTSM